MNEKNILDYVSKRSQYHPFELILDPKRFNFFEDRVFDKQTQETIHQEELYKEAFQMIAWLRLNYQSLDAKQITCSCRQILEEFPKILITNDKKTSAENN